MVEIDNIDSEVLKTAVKSWAGFGSNSFPVRSESALASVVSKENVSVLMPIITALEDDFYKSKAHLTAPSLAEMGGMAAKDFKSLYPNIPDEVVEVFAWCYTYDYK